MLASVALLGTCLTLSSYEIEFKIAEAEIEVLIDGREFATVHFADRSRPYVYPVYGPTGAQMLRNYPFVEGVEGEEYDHPHHTGIWFGHGEMNGVDIWHQVGSFKIDGSPRVSGATVWLDLEMLDADGQAFGSCKQRLTFGQTGETTRFMDYEILLAPIAGASLTFGDTKEGTMGVRTHPNLRLDRPGGNAVNSEGVSGAAVWGKRAAWIDYWGEIDGESVGIAMFDHPDNPRHPTWWHARAYGLFAANPFGVAAFENKPAGAGDLELAVDEKIRFRYRLLFHTGTAESAGIEAQYRTWANGEKD